ncbi:protein of unknown function [Streptomyces murinus]
MARAAQSWRPRPPSRSGLAMGLAEFWSGTSRSGYWSETSMRTPSSVRRQSTSAWVPACTTALVTSSLVRTTASSTMSAKPQPWSVSRTKDRAVATDRPTGSKLAAARAVITELLGRLSAGRADGPAGSSRCCGIGASVGRCSGGCPPGISPVVMVCGRPSDARSYWCHRPGRTGPVRLDSRMQGYLPSLSERVPVAGVYPPGCADDVRSCRTVMAWFGQGETLGKLLMKVGSRRVCSVNGGQQLLVWPDLIWQKYAAVTGTRK